MNTKRKKPSADLRKYYTVFLEIGAIVILLLFIVAMKVEFESVKTEVNLVQEQEVVEMEDIAQTEQEEVPPPPPRPQVPVEVPNDEIIEDQEINLDADLDLDQKLEMPDPPKEEEEDTENFFVAVENMPEMKGGQQWLYDNIKYPEMARKAGIEGRVVVQFVVNKNGKAENFQILRSIGGGCDEAAIDVIKKAEFTPGSQRGTPVPVQMALSVVFQLRK